MKKLDAVIPFPISFTFLQVENSNNYTQCIPPHTTPPSHAMLSDDIGYFYFIERGEYPVKANIFNLLATFFFNIKLFLINKYLDTLASNNSSKETLA